MIEPAENNKEQLCWVDLHDQVLGQVDRKKAHDEELLHREIALLVYDENRRVLFQKRSMKKRSNPGLWSTSVAGHIRYGHEAMEEISREAEEELGLREVEFEYLGKELIEEKNDRYFASWFKVKVGSTYHFKLNPEEVDEVSFLGPDTLKEMMKSGKRFNLKFVRRVKYFWEGNIGEGLL